MVMDTVTQLENIDIYSHYKLFIEHTRTNTHTQICTYTHTHKHTMSCSHVMHNRNRICARLLPVGMSTRVVDVTSSLLFMDTDSGVAIVVILLASLTVSSVVDGDSSFIVEIDTMSSVIASKGSVYIQQWSNLSVAYTTRWRLNLT